MKMHLPGLSRYRRANGSWAYRVRAEGNRHRRVTLPCGPDHPEFHRCYTEARRGVAPKIDESDVIPRSLAWLIIQFERHMATQVAAGLLHPGTAKQRSSFYARLSEYSDKHMAMPRRVVLEIQDSMKATPGAATNMVKALRAMFAWAVERGLVSDNPATGVSPLKRGTGTVPWSLDDLAKFRKRHPAGTMAHLALTLFVFTGCRLGDAYRLGRRNETRTDGVLWLEWEPEKAGSKLVSIPVLPPLRAALDRRSVIGPTYLLNGWGQPFASKNAFGNWFRDRVLEAGLERRSAHGIRKASAELLAEADATQHQIMAVLGHAQARTSEIYTAGASRRRLAAEAMQKLGTLNW